MEDRGRIRVLLAGPTPPWAPNPYVLDLGEALAAIDDLDVTVAPVAEAYPGVIAPQRTAGATGSIPRRGYDLGPELRWRTPWRWLELGVGRWDVVHLQWWNYALLPEFAVIAALSRARGAKVVVTVHNAYPHEGGRPRRWFNRRGADLGTAIVAHTEATRKGLTEQGVDPALVSVIPHGVRRLQVAAAVERAAARAALGIAEGERVALQFGTIRPYKRTLEVVERFAELRDGRLIVAGAPWGAYGQAVQRRVKELQLGDRVILDLRTVDEATKQRYYAAADVALVPRRMDAASGALAEALAHGLELETWGDEPVDYRPWGEVGERTAALYRGLLGLTDGTAGEELAA